MDKARLIADIHKETGIQIDEADPLMAAAIINERLLDASLADLRKLIKGSAEQLAAVGVANETAAKRLASDVVNSAAEYLGTQFKDAAREAAAEMLAEMRKETAKAEKASRIAVRAAYVSGIIGAGALSAIFGFGLAGL